MTDSNTVDPAQIPLDGIVQYQRTTTCRILGSDQHGRKHCYWPHSGQITIRERDDETTETVQMFTLNGTTVVEYRHLVTTFVADIEMEWNDDAFPQ